jgi:hypothetical protein
MTPESIDAVLSQSIPVSGCGLLLLAVAVLVIIPGVIAKRPEKPDPGEHWSQQAYQHSSNVLWLIIVIACLIFACALAGEVGGIDTLSGVTPR